MVEGIVDVGSNCSKDTTNASLQDGVQGLSYIPNSKGDENTNIGDEEVEIPLGSSLNKLLGSSTNKISEETLCRKHHKPQCKGKLIIF
jgi:hypothetical protein